MKAQVAPMATSVVMKQHTFTQYPEASIRSQIWKFNSLLYLRQLPYLDAYSQYKTETKIAKLDGQQLHEGTASLSSMTSMHTQLRLNHKSIMISETSKALNISAGGNEFQKLKRAR